MRGFATTVLMGIRMYLRDRGAVFWGIAFPLILMTLVGLAFGRSSTPTYSVAVVDRDAGLLGQGLVAGLRGVPVFDIVEASDLDTALGQLRQGRLTLVVVLPLVGSGDPVRAYFDQSRSADGQTALAILQRFVAEANLRLSGATPTVRVQATGVAGRVQLRFLDFLLPGILAMTVMQTGLSGVTYVVTTYRQRLILKRILATPAHPAVFLGGLVGRYTLTSLFQMAVLIAVAVLVFHAKIVGSLTTLAALIVVGTLTFVGMGFAISTLSSTPESANLLGSAISFPMMFLAGVFWPREFMPPAFQPVINLLPLTPLVDVIRAVSARGESLGPYLWGLAYLAMWGAVSFLVAARRFRWE